ncbi:hypothetical protein PV325_004474 [Microctonus aethiopoides]|nr:hypothetical protein PV325_004474 [Microctonus aethiopoides]
MSVLPMSDNLKVMTAKNSSQLNKSREKHKKVHSNRPKDALKNSQANNLKPKSPQGQQATENFKRNGHSPQCCRCNVPATFLQHSHVMFPLQCSSNIPATFRLQRCHWNVAGMLQQRSECCARRKKRLSNKSQDIVHTDDDDDAADDEEDDDKIRYLMGYFEKMSMIAEKIYKFNYLLILDTVE